MRNNILPPLNLEYKAHEHILTLDGLRGFAIFLVFFNHCMMYVKLFRIGWIGVDLFFVLSGFLITGILIDSKGSAHYYKNFIIRRALRIFPLYYLFLLLFIVVLPNLLPSIFTNFGYYESHQAWYWLYASNWLRSIYGNNDNQFLHHLWSLSVEEQFYLFWPFIVSWLSLKNLVRLCLILIPFCVIFRTFGDHLGFVFPFQYFNTFSRMDSLLIGALIAIFYRARPVLLQKITPVVFAVSLVIGCISFIWKEQENYTPFLLTFTFVELIFGCFLVYSISRSENIFNRIFKARWLRFLGKYSYGLYVYHWPIYLIITTKIADPLHIHFPFDKFAFTFICAILSILVAILSYNFFEAPFLRLKKYFENSPLDEKAAVPLNVGSYE